MAKTSNRLAWLLLPPKIGSLWLEFGEKSELGLSRRKENKKKFVPIGAGISEMAKSSRKPKQQQSSTMVLSRNGGFSLIASNSPSSSSRSTPLKNLHQHTSRSRADEAEEMLLYQGVGLSPAHSHQESSSKVSPTHHQRGMAGNQRVEKTTQPRLFPPGVRNANNDEAVYHEPFQSRASTSPIRFHPQGDESSSSSTTIPAVHLLTK
ncbi:hypothetical protein TCAL_15710, partial [Tigriopus californicus]